MSFWKVPPYVMDLQVYEEAVTVSEFTDGGAAAGTYTCTFDLPVGFLIVRAVLTDVTGFAGDTSAVIIIGDGSDTDRLNTGTPSIFASATVLALGVPSGTQGVVTAFKPVLTVTSASDFTSVKSNGAGALTLKVMGHVVR